MNKNKLIVFSLISTLLSGCSTIPEAAPVKNEIICETFQAGTPPKNDGYEWVFVANEPEQVVVCWEHVKDIYALAKICGTGIGVQACSSRNLNGVCDVYSRFSLSEAKTAGAYTPSGLVTGFSHVSLYEHEVSRGHCARWDHPNQAFINPILPRK